MMVLLLSSTDGGHFGGDHGGDHGDDDDDDDDDDNAAAVDCMIVPVVLDTVCWPLTKAQPF